MLKNSKFLLPLLCSSLIIYACSANSIINDDHLLKNQEFIFPQPELTREDTPLSLWATFYYLPQFNDGLGNIPLRDMEGNELGPKLSLKEWCHSALEGSVRVHTQIGEYKTYNYHGISEVFPVDCKSEFKFNLSQTKFRISKTQFGEGINEYLLAPYRTIATDPMFIPTGTVLYIPAARGAKIVLRNGNSVTHDGYFFAADKGGAIKGNHIDVFIGVHNNSLFFPWIANSPVKTFQAYIIKDQSIIDEIVKLHLMKNL